MFHLKKKKKEAAVHHVHYSINQTLPLDGNNAFDQFFEKKKNEDSLKNKIDQKSIRRRQLPSSTKNKEEKKKEEIERKGSVDNILTRNVSYRPFYSLSFASVGVLYQGFSVPLDDRQHHSV